MSHRRARLSNIVRDVVSDAIANRVWDPRIHHFTSVTRVELSPDLRIANVHVSVMGSEAEAGTTMKGLESARGMIQTRVARRLDIRQCPSIRFHLDKGLKAAIETIRHIEELDNGSSPGGKASTPDAGPSPEEPRSDCSDLSSECGVDQ